MNCRLGGGRWVGVLGGRVELETSTNTDSLPVGRHHTRGRHHTTGRHHTRGRRYTKRVF